MGLPPAVTPGLFRGPPGGRFPRVVIERQPSVYILASAPNGTLYVGVTSDLVRRVAQHRAGTFDGFTKQHGVTRLAYFEMADTMEAAIAREKQLKKWRRDWKRNLIERENPKWDDLAAVIGLEPLRQKFWRGGPRNESGVTIKGEAP